VGFWLLRSVCLGFLLLVDVVPYYLVYLVDYLYLVRQGSRVGDLWLDRVSSSVHLIEIVSLGRIRSSSITI
jgi:hypothetical protein